MMNDWPSPALSETSFRTESTGQGRREELFGDEDIGTAKSSSKK